MLSCRTKLEKLLCLKYLGNNSCANSGVFQTTKLLPTSLQDTIASVAGSSTISKVLVRKGGGPELWGASICDVGFPEAVPPAGGGIPFFSFASADGHCVSPPISNHRPVLALRITDHSSPLLYDHLQLELHIRMSASPRTDPAQEPSTLTLVYSARQKKYSQQLQPKRLYNSILQNTPLKKKGDNAATKISKKETNEKINRHQVKPKTKKKNKN